MQGIYRVKFAKIFVFFCVLAACSFLSEASFAAKGKKENPHSQLINPHAPALIKAENGEVYFKPSLVRMIEMLMRLGSLDSQDNAIIDEYEMINDCKVYDHFFQDEFRWREVQDAARKEVLTKISSFPLTLYYDATLRLSRYDFDAKLFRFEKKGSGDGVNTFTIEADGQGVCGQKKIRYLPVTFKIVLQHRMQLPGLSLTADEAQKLSKRMEEMNNTTRLVFVRFKIRGVYAEKFGFSNKNPLDPQRSLAQGGGKGAGARIDSRLDLIEFYEDEARTKLITTMKP